MDTTAILKTQNQVTYLKSDLIEGIVLDRQIGSGATSLVFLGRDCNDEKKLYAVKLLSPFLVMQEEPRKRWQREADLLIRLSHPNIVRGIRHGIVENRPYLVMEFLRGENLLDRMTRLEKLPEHEVIAVARESLKALEAAHTQNIIHRDVKPANIIWLNDGTIKLMDFGLAKFMDDTGLTAAGTVVGTPVYISPEQAAGDEEITGQTDLYALGSTLFHLACGRPPFTEINTSLLLTRKITDEVPDVRLMDETISGELAFFIATLSARDPAGRPAGPAEALGLLDRLESGELTTTSFQPKPKSSLAPVRPASLDQIPQGNEVLDTIVGEESLATQPTFLEAGEVLFYEDDDSRECYVLLSGKVEVLRSGRRIAEISEPGSFIGEMSPLNGVPRSATVRAVEQTVMLRITEDDFAAFFSSRPAMSLALARSLATRLNSTSGDLQETRTRLAIVSKHLKEATMALGK